MQRHSLREPGPHIFPVAAFTPKMLLPRLFILCPLFSGVRLVVNRGEPKRLQQRVTMIGKKRVQIPTGDHEFFVREGIDETVYFLSIAHLHPPYRSPSPLPGSKGEGAG